MRKQNKYNLVYRPIRDVSQNQWLYQWQSLGKIKLKVLLFFAISVLMLFAAQLIFAGNLATDGEKLTAVQQDIKRLEAENTTLKVKIAQESSLTNLSQKAQKLGFSQPSKIVTP